MRTRLILVVFSLSMLRAAAEDHVKPGPAPDLPFSDWGACPFEGCTYREWTVRKPVAVYDTWKASRSHIQDLGFGVKVKALTGVVITVRPGLIRMDRDYDPDLKKGDTVLTYTYEGEGFSSVWFQGAFHSEFDISFAKSPDGTGCGGDHCAGTYVDLGEKQWWAQIQLKSGAGWVDMNHSDFDGTDMLASLPGDFKMSPARLLPR